MFSIATILILAGPKPAPLPQSELLPAQDKELPGIEIFSDRKRRRTAGSAHKLGEKTLQRQGHDDVHRFEKISNIIKQFKLSCIKTNYQFKSMVVKNEKFTSFIDEFTSSTYIMVIVSDPDIEQEMISMNIKASRTYFESIVQNGQDAQ